MLTSKFNQTNAIRSFFKVVFPQMIFYQTNFFYYLRIARLVHTNQRRSKEIKRGNYSSKEVDVGNNLNKENIEGRILFEEIFYILEISK